MMDHPLTLSFALQFISALSDSLFFVVFAISFLAFLFAVVVALLGYLAYALRVVGITWSSGGLKVRIAPQEMGGGQSDEANVVPHAVGKRKYGGLRKVSSGDGPSD